MVNGGERGIIDLYILYIYYNIYIIYININIGYKLDYNNRKYITVQWCNGAMTQNEEMKNANVRCKM